MEKVWGEGRGGGKTQSVGPKREVKKSINPALEKTVEPWKKVVFGESGRGIHISGDEQKDCSSGRKMLVHVRGGTGNQKTGGEQGERASAQKQSVDWAGGGEILGVETPYGEKGGGGGSGEISQDHRKRHREK